MDNYKNDNTARYYKAHVSVWGTSQIHLRNPYIIGWWSAAFPGFGHLLLSKYLRGYALFIWEVLINIKANVNLAMVYSFQGNIGMAKEILDTRWLLMYIPVYFFAIWDSYRTTVDMNKVYILAKNEGHQINTFSLGPLEINYLDKRNPIMPIMWTLFVPGLGQLYIHRILTAFFLIFWVVVFFYFSHAQQAVSLLFLGKIPEATSVLNPEWLLFLPSHYGFATFDSYMNTVENNKLYEEEQRRYLTKTFQPKSFRILKRQKSGVIKMQLFSTFESNSFLEMAISTLEKNGIKKEDIYALPLCNRTEERKVFDSLHRSDGTSLVDIGIALATAFAVIGASIGFKLAWGPIYWGLISAFIGFVIGFSIRIYTEVILKKKKRIRRGKHSEIILIVNCEEPQSELIKEILFNHYAFGVAAVK